MKLPLHAALIASAVLCAVSCSPKPGDDPAPVPDASASMDADANPPADTDPQNAAQARPENPLAMRLRLPEMENLPSDRELAAKQQPDKDGGGVIARPPSE